MNLGERPTLTELEDVLAGDHLGRQRQAWLTRLTGAALALEREAGQAVNDEARAALLRRRAACLAAVSVIDTLWTRLHG